jgi:hypothetical protein
MTQIQVHELGKITEFIGEYQRDLETDRSHVYITDRGDLLKFDKHSILYVSEQCDTCPDTTPPIGASICIEPINYLHYSLIFDGVKHPITTGNWCYYITNSREKLHVNRRHFKC